MIKKKSSLLLAILWLLISTILLTLPGSSLPKEDWLGKLWVDKWVHIGMFAIMVFLWGRVFQKKPVTKEKLKIIFWWVASLSLAYGIGMELVQKYFIPNRSFDVGDIIADAAGCLSGLVYSTRRYKKN